MCVKIAEHLTCSDITICCLLVTGKRAVGSSGFHGTSAKYASTAEVALGRPSSVLCMHTRGGIHTTAAERREYKAVTAPRSAEHQLSICAFYTIKANSTHQYVLLRPSERGPLTQPHSCHALFVLSEQLLITGAGCAVLQTQVSVRMQPR